MRKKETRNTISARNYYIIRNRCGDDEEGGVCVYVLGGGSYVYGFIPLHFTVYGFFFLCFVCVRVCVCVCVCVCMCVCVRYVHGGFVLT